MIFVSYVLDASTTTVIHLSNNILKLQDDNFMINLNVCLIKFAPEFYEDDHYLITFIGPLIYQ
jgi:hypothetical protein